MKDPAKVIDKTFRRLGATRGHERHGVTYTFPDGARKFVSTNIRAGAASNIIQWAQERYTPTPDVLGARRVHTPPVIS